VKILSDLINAVYRKDINKIEALVNQGLDVNGTDDDGRTPLMHAVLAESPDPEIIRLLISLGANVDSSDNGQQWTALHFAARDQKFEIIQILLKNGARIDPSDIFGNSPLWRCVMNNSPDVRIVKLLLENGADPQKQNKNGKSPWDITQMLGNDEIIDVMQEYRK
jgi:ankyrin repeat protein